MLQRIEELLLLGEDFAVETTLTTRSYVTLINKAKALEFYIHLAQFSSVSDRARCRKSEKWRT